MELQQVLTRRTMVRRYDRDRLVPEPDLEQVLVAALRAPSAGFTQATSLLVLAESAQRDRFFDLTAAGPSRWLEGMRTAPVLVLVFADREAYLDRYAEPDKGWTDRDPERWSAPYWFVDAGMASMAALLRAVDVGLGACFFGIPVDRIDAVKAEFGVPAEQFSVGVLSLGYPAPGLRAAGSPSRRRRRPTEELVHRGGW